MWLCLDLLNGSNNRIIADSNLDLRQCVGHGVAYINIHLNNTMGIGPFLYILTKLQNCTVNNWSINNID